MPQVDSPFCVPAPSEALEAQRQKVLAELNKLYRMKRGFVPGLHETRRAIYGMKEYMVTTPRIVGVEFYEPIGE